VILRLALILALLGLAGAAAGAERRDPCTQFFHPMTGDLKAELSDARSAGRKAVFLMFEQERRRRKDS
jgi:hypothetical protein